MEKRQITIVSSRTQQEYVINTNATTLKELKAALDKENIDYSGLAFFEGISQTEMLNDDAILPSNLLWKGKRTNELVFLLTESQKKIKNGAQITTRTEAYDYIKKHNLKEAILKVYGINYTNCTTTDLLRFCNKSCGTTKKVKSCKKKAILTPRTEIYIYIKEHNLSADITDFFGKNYTQCSTESLIDFCNKTTKKSCTKKVPKKSKFSKEDIDNMFKNII